MTAISLTRCASSLSQVQLEFSESDATRSPTMLSRESLIARAKAGERDAFEQLARLYLRPAYSVALAIVRRPADAEDVAQDALLLALERLDSCREPDKFTSWVLTIVRNQARNWLDKRKLRDVLPEPPAESGESAPGAVEVNLVRDELLAALEVLTPTEREVLLLHDLDGYTHEEIGQMVNVSCVMSRQHLFVSRKKLRKALGRNQDEGGTDES